MEENPDIQVTPPILAFGDVLIGNTRNLTLTIGNVGNADLVVASAVVTGAGFTAPPYTNVTITPGNTSTLTVTFAPTQVQNYAGTVTITSNDPDEAVVAIPLTGAGVMVAVPDIDVTPAALTFGDVVINTTRNLNLTIGNVGFANLVVASAVVAGAGFTAPAFTNVTITPENTATLTVTFAPILEQGYAGTVTIISNDPDEPTVIVNLNGTGVPPAGPHYTPVPPTGRPYAIIVDDCIMAGETMTTGEIGIFDADLCVGAEMITGAYPIPITAWQGDPANQLPGFTPGNPIIYSIWDGIQEYDATAVYIGGHGDGTFGIGAYTEVVLTAVIPLNPDIDVTPGTLAFGNVVVGQTSNRTLTIANTGQTDLIVASAIVTGVGFTAPPYANVTITPGNTSTLTVTFAPTLAQAYTGMVTITSNDPDEQTVIVNLTGTGIAVANVSGIVSDIVTANPIVGASVTIGGVNTTTGPTGNYTINNLNVGANNVLITAAGYINYTDVINLVPGNNVVNFQLTPLPTDPDISVTPSPLAFGNVVIGNTPTRDLTIWNFGGQNLVVASAVVAGAGFTAPPFTNITITPNNSATLPVTFAPTAVQNYTGTATFTCNDPDEPTVVVNLTGAGVTALVPDIELSTTLLAFGDVFIGFPRTLDLTISNVGDVNLTIASAGIVGDCFSIPPFQNVVVTPGNRQVLAVTFAPDDIQNYAGILSITSDDPDEGTVTVNLTGRGLEIPEIMLSTNALNFGEVNLGEQSTLDLTIYNTGGSDLIVTGVVTGACFSAPTFQNVIIAPEEDIDLTITFAPTQVTTYTGLVTFTSNDPLHPEVTATLSGVGIQLVGSIVGTVTECGTDAPIVGASVTLTIPGVPTPVTHTTDVLGHYEFIDLVPGTEYALTFEDVDHWTETEENIIVVANLVTTIDKVMTYPDGEISTTELLITVYLNEGGHGSGSVDLTALACGRVEWTAWIRDNFTWITVDPSEGVLPASESVTITLDVDTTGAGLNAQDGQEVTTQLLFSGEKWDAPPTVNVTVFFAIGVYNDFGQLPTRYMLHQNYPNPFNPTTHIEFDLVEPQNVTLTVFDVTGREVARLVDGYMIAGFHQIEFVSTDLPSGLYFLAIKTEAFQDVKRMVLIK